MRHNRQRRTGRARTGTGTGAVGHYLPSNIDEQGRRTGVSDWWTATGSAASHVPLTLCLVAFVLTFLATRLVTRLIRSGRGPFKDLVTLAGLHVHHAVPGLILLLTGAVISVASGVLAFRCVAAVLIGAGASLVLDEFALILHLRDVYWSNEGRASVQAVALMVVVLMLAVLGLGPDSSVNLGTGGTNSRVGTTVIVVVFVLAGVVCAIKGKFRLLVIAVLVPFVAIFGAVRLARPGSPWFRRYPSGSRKQRRAIRRVQRQDQRWGPRLSWVADLVAGSPTAYPKPAALPPATTAAGSVSTGSGASAQQPRLRPSTPWRRRRRGRHG